MAFTAKDVSVLRERTGCGMMDCKKALTEANGDMDKAVELLREKGLAASAKKAGRIAAEGLVLADVDEAKKTGRNHRSQLRNRFCCEKRQLCRFCQKLRQRGTRAEPRRCHGPAGHQGRDGHDHRGAAARKKSSPSARTSRSAAFPAMRAIWSAMSTAAGASAYL